VVKIEGDRNAKNETNSHRPYQRQSGGNLSHFARFNQGGPNVVDRSADPLKTVASATSSAMT
jgi:hypothetical protein